MPVNRYTALLTLPDAGKGVNYGRPQLRLPKARLTLRQAGYSRRVSTSAMFTSFFLELRKAHLPVSMKEYLLLLEAVKQGLADYRVDDFYYLSRSALVKDERNLDKFDRVFGHVFKGLEMLSELFEPANIPEDWLRKMAELHLTEEEKAEIEAMGGWEKLMEELKKRLEEQKGRHQGGNKWIGTAGKSPYGAYGYNPEGVRIGQDGNRNFSAVKVWDKREFRNLDDSVEPEFRRVRMKFDLKGVFEAKSGTTPITGTALWFEMLKGSAVTFYPMGDSGPLTRVIPDVRHTPTVVAFKGGMRRRKNSLRFAENEWRQPTDTHFDDFKDLIANL